MDTDLPSDLPSDLRAGLDRAAQGISRHALGRRSAAISQAYRSGQGSAQAIQSADDALAYALARLPATFAAASSVLAALKEAAPDFAPRTFLDVGAGPGTACWAAVGCFPGLTALHLVDDNVHLRLLALRLLSGGAVGTLRDATYRQGDVGQLIDALAAADLTIASYVVGELPAARLLDYADALWSKTAGILVVIEPGTPAGFARVRSLRSHLVGRHAHVVAPCPHDHECPLAGGDWCHFSQRLNRSRDHGRVKGAALSFEDEKFSYVALSRVALGVPRRDRVLASPRVTKALVTTKLCTPDGVAMDVASRRDADTYRERKRWRWGDAVSREADGRANP